MLFKVAVKYDELRIVYNLFVSPVGQINSILSNRVMSTFVVEYAKLSLLLIKLPGENVQILASELECGKISADSGYKSAVAALYGVVLQLFFSGSTINIDMSAHNGHIFQNSSTSDTIWEEVANRRFGVKY